MKLHRKTPRGERAIPSLARSAGLALVVGAAGAWLGLGAAPGVAQVLLEPEPGAVVLWSSQEGGALRSVRVPLAPSLRPRVAIEAEGGHVVAGSDEATGELFFLHEAGGVTLELPVPGPRSGAVRTWPVLVEAAGRLEGALWLEGSGPQALAVRAATWNGTSWETEEIVSPSTGRPQLAVSATVLSDGTWLALWAGFDGQDDEIYWSRRVDGAWSPPRRLGAGNEVPDILPSVVADGDGARAAWSVYDGSDYRVRTARWDGAGWRIEGMLEGLGAIDAAWQRQDGRAFVVFHSVLPDGWTVVELDRAGGVLHRSTVAGEVTRRPLVAVAGYGSPPRLVLPSANGRPRR